MATFLLRQITKALLAALALTGTAFAQSFLYTDAANGGVAASFTLNASLPTILSGSGSITSSYWSGVDNLVLVTQNTVLPAGNGQITSAGLPHVFNWVGVTNSSLTNFTGDDFLGAVAPYVDSNGLVFEIVNPATQAIVGGFHFWVDSNQTTFSDVIAGAGNLLNTAASGSSTGLLAAVPEPSSYALMIGGLGMVGIAARRRRPPRTGSRTRMVQ